MQAKAPAREMSKPYFVDLRQLRTGLGRMNHGFFYSTSFSVEELNEIGETDFESQRFLNVRFKKLSTNQNRGIA